MNKRETLVVNIQSLFDELPPSDVPAEVATLGSIVLDPRVIVEIEGVGLSPDMFSLPKHTTIYEALVSLHTDQVPLDMVTITRRLSDRSVLDQIGGVEYLIHCFESVPSAVSAAHYARQVVESHRKRQIIDLAGRMLHRAYKTSDDAKDQAWGAQSELEQIGSGHETPKVITRQEASERAYQELHDRAAGGYISGLRTGFNQFDEDVAGLKGGNLYILAARPGMGKTAWALQICNHVASSGTPTLFVSIEMPPDQIGMRDLAYSSGLSLAQVRQPSMMIQREWEQVERAMDQDRGELYILDAAGMPLQAIESTAKRLQSTKGVGLVVIDFLQLMQIPKGVKKYEGVGDNAKGSKQLARRLDVPTVLLSQLSRETEKRPGHRPQMSDLRDSGEIEEAADVVALLHREDYHRLNADPTAELDHVAEVIIGKNRHGPTGVVELRFMGGAFSNTEAYAGGLA